MIRRFISRVRFSAAVSIIMLLPLSAVANDGMPPSVFDIIQEGQDVKVVLQLADSGEPGINDTFKLERHGDDESVTVFLERTFALDEATYVGEPGCRWEEGDSPSEVCSRYMVEYDDTDGADEVDTPEACSDCDNDGRMDCWGNCVLDSETNESKCQETYCAEDGYCNNDCNNDGVSDCDGWCQTVYRFDIVDTCVAPGEYQYEFFTRYSIDRGWESLSWIDDNRSPIKVTDSGKECESLPGESEVEAPSCSVSTTGYFGRSLFQLIFH